MNESVGLEDVMSSKRGMLSMLKGLTEHPGWKYFGVIVEEQKTSRLGQYAYSPLKSMDDVPAQEFLKGEISGLGLSQVLLHAHIDELEREIKVIEAKLEVENERAVEEAVGKDSVASRVDGESYGE